MNQQTIKENVSLSGVGLHTGRLVNMTFKAAEVGHGIRFQRVDLEGQPIIKADVGLVVSTNRGTSIKNGDAQVSTVEHLMSGLMALGVDNLLVEIDGPEVPILDGSAKIFIETIEKVGLLEQDKPRDVLIIEEPISFKDEVTGTELIALPADTFSVTTMIDFNSDVLGKQYAQLDTMQDYKKEIASCRTFVFLHELESLIDQGLVKGGDLDNAVVLVDNIIDEERLQDLAKKLGKPGIKVEKEGVLNTTDLYFKNEPARHKLLDVIGDMALLGVPVQGKIISNKPGHTANVEFTKLLKALYTKQKRTKNVPKYDPNVTPIFDSSEIKKLLPHRYPFLMIDKIIELSDTHVVGLKNVTENESIFQGHFPDDPLFPGVLQIEGMAQTGGILALNIQDRERKHKWNTIFAKVDNVKFKSMVRPGDTILYRLELTAPIRRGIVQMTGSAYVGNRLVSEGDLTARISIRED